MTPDRAAPTIRKHLVWLSRGKRSWVTDKLFMARRSGLSFGVLLVACAALLEIQTKAGEASPRPLHLNPEAIQGFTNESSPADDKPWHFEFGFRDGYTKLGETKRILERRLETPLRLDILNFFDPPYTPLDRKTDFMLTTIYLGLGRQESDWLIWNFYVGGGTGRDRDHQRVGNVNLEVSFKYAYLFTGATAEIYPWHAPRREDFSDWHARFSASRPFVAAGFETGYISAEGRGHWKIAPLPRLYQDKERVRDWITSLNFGLGWNLPINQCWSVVLTGDYRFHFYRPDEFNGWTLTTALRYNLR